MVPRTDSAWAAACLALVAVLAAGSLLGGPADRTDREGPLVGEAVVVEALASEPPPRPTMTDAIDHFEARLAARGDEDFSRRRLVGAHLLRFRAYGAFGDLDAAGRHLAALESGSAPTAALHVARSGWHLTRHEFPAALASARAARAVAGLDAAGVRWALFDALQATGAYAEAERLLRSAPDQTTVAFLAREARALDRAGRVEEARDRFREVVERVRAWAEPAAVEAWALVELGHFEHHSGDSSRAVELYREALRVLPGSPAALEGLSAVAAGVDRDVDAAARLLERALANGAHADVMPRLADLEEARGRPARARALRDAFVAWARSDELRAAQARRPLVFLLADALDRPCDAVAEARLDLAQRRDAGAWDALAWSLFRAGDLDGAREASRRATDGGVPEPGVALRAGLVAAAAERHDRARALLDLALDGASELSAAEVADARRVRNGAAVGVPPAACGSD